MTAIEKKTSSVNVIHLAMYTILAEKIVKVLGAMISLPYYTTWSNAMGVEEAWKIEPQTKWPLFLAFIQNVWDIQAFAKNIHFQV